MYFFFYGDMKKNKPMNKILSDSNLIGNYNTKESIYDMFSVNEKSIVLEGGIYKIKGEVWFIKNSIITNIIDSMNTHPFIYKKKLIEIENFGRAWIYICVDPVNFIHEDVSSLDNIKEWN